MGMVKMKHINIYGPEQDPQQTLEVLAKLACFHPDKDAERINNVADIVTPPIRRATMWWWWSPPRAIPPTTHRQAPKSTKSLQAGDGYAPLLWEQISAALLAMAIERMGYPVVSLLGWQAGFDTSSDYATPASSG